LSSGTHLTDVTLRTLRCGSCGIKSTTEWVRDGATGLIPYSLGADFYQRDRLNKRRSGCEVVCSRCERVVVWPR
jgi:hypothetical protein